MPVREGTCPRCELPLSGVAHAGITPLMCPACRGVFLRGAELQLHLNGGELLSSGTRIFVDPQPACPAGCGPMDLLEVATAAGPIHVDVCGRCRGAWFDRRELEPVTRTAQRRARAPRHAPLRERSPEESAQRRVDAVARQQDLEGDPEGHSTPALLFSALTGLPLEGYNPVVRAPLVTWSLIAACVAVYLAQWHGGREFVLEWALIPAQFEPFGSWTKVFTAMFMHGGIAHLLGNLYFLKVFGDNVEDRFGRPWFLGFYLTSGALAAFIYTLFAPGSTVPMLGASGAIAGVLGAYLVFFPNARISLMLGVRFGLMRPLCIRALWYLPLWLGWQFLAAALGTAGVAWWAHIGGFLVGAALASLACAMLPDARLGAGSERTALE